MKTISASPEFRDSVADLPTGRSSRWPALGAATIAAALVLSACTAPAVKKREAHAPPAKKTTPAAHSASTASQPVKAPPKRAARPLPIAVLNAKNYQAGRKHREDLLVKTLGPGALSKENVGYYMEVEEADLRRRLSTGMRVRVAKQNGNIIIGPLGNAFSSGSAQIGGGLRATLDKAVPVFLEFSKTLVVVHAYTDARGNAEYNRKLSVRRALAVVHYLLKAGVASGRLVAVGHGETGPVASNHTARGRAENRRITIELDPLGRHQAGP